VLHRDLKPGNILLDDNYQIKICDFGLARSVTKVEEDEEDDGKRTEEKKFFNKEKYFNAKSNLNKYTGKSNTDSKMSTSTDEKSKSLGKPMLGQMKKQQNSKQILSVHVVTRWYRAPELILIEKDYTEAIDVWSVACIFAELMMMIKENAGTFLDRTPLFPGKFCFPLSPPDSKNRSIKINEYGFPIDKSDQLNVIFDLIGTPSDEDLDFVTDQNGLLYLKSLKYRPKRNIQVKFPGSSELALDLLDKMLQFNPKKRITVDEAIEHPFFAEVRDKSKEEEADFNLEFEFEKDENLSMDKLRSLFIQVIKSYKV
jgi:mitogen-activated protein kinase 1/3